MLEAKSRISQRMIKSKGHSYLQLYVYLPTDLVKDSQFPFKSGDTVKIKILEGSKIEIEKIEND